MTDNPFELLRMPPEATEEEIVRQGARLCQTAADDDARNAIREAVRSLTATADERRLHALLTPPGFTPAGKELDRFAAARRRAPAGAAVVVPPLDHEEARAILRELLLAGLDQTPARLEPIPDAESPEEIARQASEAAWLSLLHDTRG